MLATTIFAPKYKTQQSLFLFLSPSLHFFFGSLSIEKFFMEFQFKIAEKKTKLANQRSSFHYLIRCVCELTKKCYKICRQIKVYDVSQ